MAETRGFSNILLWGKQLDLSNDFELTKHLELKFVLPYLDDQIAKVLIINTQDLSADDLELLFRSLEVQTLQTEVIVIIDNFETELRNTLISTLNPHAIYETENYNIQDVEKSILTALRKYDYHQQNNNFYLLFQEQGVKLRELNKELEDRVVIKNKSLRRSQDRLISIQEQLNLLYECILGVQDSKNIPEIEDFLTLKLEPYFKTKWIRILVGSKEVYSETFIIENQKKYRIFGTPLHFSQKSIGHIYFAKMNSNFMKKEESFLLQLSEIVSIKINQVTNYADLLVTQSQWQQTFKAIKHQVTIVDSKFNLLNSNFDTDEAPKKCYELLFKAERPCEGCQLGKNFELKNKSEWISVTSQKIKTHDHRNDTFINIYENITERKSIELKILEKAKLSDLGILAGSLAHELNNPLAGIITFLQLILSEPDSTPANALADIQDLLDAALDCKQVIESILISVRNNKSLNLDL